MGIFVGVEVEIGAGLALSSAVGVFTGRGALQATNRISKMSRIVRRFILHVLIATASLNGLQGRIIPYLNLFANCFMS